MVINNQVSTITSTGIETRDGKRLTTLICKFLAEKGEKYVLRYRYDAVRLVGDFRLWLSLRERYCLWTDSKLYGLFTARLDYVIDLKAKFEAAKVKSKMSSQDVADLFDFCNYNSFILSTRRNKNILIFLRMVERMAP